MPLEPHELRRSLTETLGRRPEVLDAYLFGSRARGTEQARSDVDVAVYVSEVPDLPFGLEADLAAEIMKALGENRVDVIVLNRAPPLLYHRVLRDGVRLFSRRPAETTAREGRALSRYCDYVVQIGKVDEAVRDRIRRGEFGR